MTGLVDACTRPALEGIAAGNELLRGGFAACETDACRTAGPADWEGGIETIDRGPALSAVVGAAGVLAWRPELRPALVSVPTGGGLLAGGISPRIGADALVWDRAGGFDDAVVFEGTTAAVACETPL